MSKIHIEARTVYKEFEGGFWGLEASDQYLPVNFPEQLKTVGLSVHCELELLEEMESYQNWGKPCRIIRFSTAEPF